MPSGFLTNAEKERLENFPSEITEVDKTAFFTLTDNDLALISRRTGEQNRLGFAIILCCLRFLGFIPESFFNIPTETLKYLAGQLRINEAVMPTYQRIRTKQTQIQEILTYTGFRRTEKADLKELEKWLARASLGTRKTKFLIKFGN